MPVLVATRNPLKAHSEQWGGPHSSMGAPSGPEAGAPLSRSCAGQGWGGSGSRVGAKGEVGERSREGRAECKEGLAAQAPSVPRVPARSPGEPWCLPGALGSRLSKLSRMAFGFLRKGGKGSGQCSFPVLG